MHKRDLRDHLAGLFASAPLIAGKRRLQGRSPSEGGEPYQAELDEATGELRVWDLGRIHGGAHEVTWVPEDIQWHPE